MAHPLFRDLNNSAKKTLGRMNTWAEDGAEGKHTWLTKIR